MQKLFKPGFCALAPMEDVTDSVFRRIVSRHGKPDIFYSEFTSAEGLCSRGREKVIHRLKFTEEEKPIIAQLWAVKPDAMQKAASTVQELGFDGVDINMGCPVPKIVKNGACSALIENPEAASRLIDAARKGAPDLPLSVKTRCGFSSWQTEDWISHLLGCGLDALTVHGRISKDMSKYPARWEEIEKAVHLAREISPDTVIIGNGDLRDRAHSDEYVKKYGVHGTMIGRGVFADLAAFSPENSFLDYTVEQKLEALREHVELFREYWDGIKNFRVLKKFFKIYIHGFRDASFLRDQLVNADDYSDFFAILDSVKH